MRRIIFGILMWLAYIACAADTVSVLTINGPITATTKDYIFEELSWAKQNNIQAIIIELNTPGGLLNVTEEITTAIINQPIPVITYVTPSGGKAASAGTFIAYASHFAAMAPSTSMGAASPITLNQDDNGDAPSTMMKKVVSITVNSIRNLAIRNHRNADWAERAITEAVTTNEKDALKDNVINAIALNNDDLLSQLQGKTYYLTDQQGQTFDLEKPKLLKRPMSWRLSILSFITQPEVAYGLLMLGIYALFFELYSPGAILPGVLGVISLLLAAYAFQFLPIEGSGLALLIAGFIMLLSELFITSYGLLGIAGITAIIVGSIMLFDPAQMSLPFSTGFLASIAFVGVGIVLIIARLTLFSIGRVPTSGSERLQYVHGTVVSIDKTCYIILIEGERWRAQCDTPLKVGDQVTILDHSSLILKVQPYVESP
ncbi:MAG: NfeD family protein [Candidatus Comchoanobacterales bacterium]